MKCIKQKRFGERGLGLVELMIAIALSLLLSAALIQAYIASKTTFQMQDSMSLLQENGRFAVNYLSKELRMAGFIGCPAFSTLTQYDDLVPAPAAEDFPAFTQSQVIRAGSPATYSDLVPNAVAGTDVLIVQKGSATTMRLESPSSSSGLTLHDNSAGLTDGDILLVSDCTHATLFQAETVNANAVTTSATLPSGSSAYTTDAEVMALESTVFYIRNTGRQTRTQLPILSLYMKTRGAGSKGVTSDAVELVEGVQDLQVEFGVNEVADAANAADKYVEAKDVADWQQVVSVRVSLLLQGVDDKAVNGDEKMAQTISFNKNDIAPDGRLRQVFNATIALRNRLP